MMIGVTVLLCVLWSLGLENNRSFAFLYAGLFALAAWSLLAFLHERRRSPALAKPRRHPEAADEI